MAKHDKSDQNEQSNEQLITTDMLDMKLDGITYSSKMKTKASKNDTQVESMLELDYTGATLREVIGWSFKDRRIAQQNVMRNLGQSFIESTPIVSVIAVEIKSAGVRQNVTAEQLIADGIANGKTPEQIADGFLEAIKAKQAKMIELAKQQAKDEADLMDGVTIPNE